VAKKKVQSGSSVKDSDGEIDALEKKYKKIAKEGRKKGYMLAAENLEYWLSKKGGTKTIPVSYFESDETVNDFLKNKVRAVFLSREDSDKGIVPRIKKDNKVGAEYSMEWTDSMDAKWGSELYWAMGGFTIISKVKMKVVAIKADKAKVKFTSWNCRVRDVYNWDEGKSVVYKTFKIKDDDAIKVEKAGRAKSFNMKSEPWEVKNKSVVGDAVVDLS